MSEKSSPRFTRFVTWFVDLSFKRPIAVLAIFAALAGVSLWESNKLVFKSSFVELLPDNSREVNDLNLVAKKAGGVGYRVVQIKGAEQKTLAAFADAVAPQLETHKDDIRYVEYRYDLKFFKRRALLLLPAEKLKGLHDDLKTRIDWEKAHANPL